MTKTEYKPRLTVEITPEQNRVLKRYLEHGMRKQVFGIIIEDMVSMLDTYGSAFLIALITRRISMKDYVNGDNGKFTDNQRT